MKYIANSKRYEKMQYKRSGSSGIKLPKISLGLWQNFGSYEPFEKSKKILHRAFDLGITHFDLANNYGPTPGTAEENMGKLLTTDLKKYRDEMIISTKAGYLMWEGPYGEFGSRKNLIASLDQSLHRMKLDYVDIFYSHRPDYETPLEETMGALAHVVQQGKALYAGISNYDADYSQKAIEILNSMNVPCLIHQARYSMLDRWVEEKLLDLLSDKGVGMIAFSPLAQGLLTNKYINKIPKGSRIEKKHGTLQKDILTDDILTKINQLNNIAAQRNQSLSQMAISWLLKDERVTSVLIGVSSVKQLEENYQALQNQDFSDEELTKIEKVISE